MKRMLRLALLPTLALACARVGDEPEPEPRAASTPVPAEKPAEKPPAPALPPLRDAAWLEALPLEGFGPASVSVPLGATEPRPVMVGVHGRGDRPEWACGAWRGVTEAHPFIVCPHGTPRDAKPGVGLSFADAATTEAEVQAGLAALHRRFGPHVAPGPLVYAGFSLGAILAPKILASKRQTFPFAVLAEGGQDRWTDPAMRAWAAAGGRRVLLVCSTQGCEAVTRPLVPRFSTAGIEARFVSAGNIGHIVDDRVVRAIRSAFPWLVEQDGRWGERAR